MATNAVVYDDSRATIIELYDGRSLDRSGAAVLVQEFRRAFGEEALLLEYLRRSRLVLRGNIIWERLRQLLKTHLFTSRVVRRRTLAEECGLPEW